MKRLIISLMTALTLALVPMAGAMTPASATSRATLSSAAQQVAFESVNGGAYSKYSKLYPKELNWTNDGCSVPNYVLIVSPALGLVLKKYGSVFKASCIRHDFGYRNFGSNAGGAGPHPKFSPTKATKDRIDTTFYNNMVIQCKAKYSAWITRKACTTAASTFYTAVKYGGSKSFFA